MKTILRSVLPELLMVAIMAVLALAFMSPVFQGKVLYQNDIVQAKSMSHEVEQFQKVTGEYSAWTNSAFSGMPTYQIKSAPSGNIFHWLFRAFKIYLPGYTVAILFICMLGFYFLLRTLRLNRWLALAGAVAFGFGAHNLQLIGAGHVSKIYAIAYMAPVIAGMFLVLKRKYLIGGLVTAIGFGIQLVTNHPQVSYYLGMIILIYLLVELVFAIREKYFDHLVKSGITLFIALLLAILPNMTALMTTQEYSKETTRGKSELVKPGETKTKGLDVKYITDWSYGVSETLNLFIPNFSGGGSGTDLGTNSAMYQAMIKNQIPEQQAKQATRGLSYWGSQTLGTAGPHYIGAISVFLAVLGLFIVKGKKKWWLAAIIVLSILLSWGRNFLGLTEFFVHNVPLYSKFRDVTNTLIIAQFAIPLLAFLAIREWFADTQTDLKVKLKNLWMALGIAGGVALLVALIPTLFGSFTSGADKLPDWVMEPLRQDRISLARSDAFRTLLFVLAAGGLLWFSLKSKMKKEYLYMGLGLLILLDMWSVGKRYLNDDNFISKRQIEQAYKATPADETIMKDKDAGYRVLDLTSNPFQSGRASRFHKSIGGYHGAKLGRYQDLIDKYVAPNTAAIAEVFQDKPTFEKFDAAIANMKVLNMLNTRYVIISPTTPVENSHAQGDVWFVDRVKIVANANEELDALGTTSLTEEAVVDQRFQSQLATLPAMQSPSAEPDMIALSEYKPNYLKYNSKTSGIRLAVFSQIYYPYGWEAFIDGKKSDYMRANYALRALVVPAGQHTIEFRFEPGTLKKAQTISLIGSFMVILLILGTGVMEWRRKKQVQ